MRQLVFSGDAISHTRCTRLALPLPRSRATRCRKRKNEGKISPAAIRFPTSPLASFLRSSPKQDLPQGPRRQDLHPGSSFEVLENTRERVPDLEQFLFRGFSVEVVGNAVSDFLEAFDDHFFLFYDPF